MKCPRCSAATVEVTARYHHHRYVMGRPIPGIRASRTSRLRCTACRYEWPTRARVERLPDAAPVHQCCPGFGERDLAAVLAAIDERAKGRIWPAWDKTPE